MAVTPARIAAVNAGRLAGVVSRTLGRGGGAALPGLVAGYIDPRLVSNLAREIPRGSILVTGTNGKTTTSRTIAIICETQGWQPLHNRTGSNLMRGIASALIGRTDLSSRLRAGRDAIGLFEVDEAVLPHAVRALRPRWLLLGNLFRDQLDRYGEVDTVARIWGEAIRALPRDAIVVGNADDPTVAALTEDAPDHLLYGLEDTSQDQGRLGLAADARWCPRCQAALDYQAVFYGHVGHYRCPRCGWQRPTPALAATAVASQGFAGSQLCLRFPDGSERPAFLKLPGLYNAYNALAAAAVATALEIPPATTVKGIEALVAAFGRMEKLTIQGRTVYLLLVKNPTGCTEVLRAIESAPGPLNLWVILNDRVNDGHDVSWIWDSDFERLAGRVSHAVASGLRAEDMGMRLKYAEAVSPDGANLTVERELPKALRQAIAQTPPGGTLYVLPTYTAMLELRELLARLGHVGHYWE